jgi:uncharacterized protein YpmB
MWVLFFLIITAPKAYEVHPMNTYEGPRAEAECKAKSQEIMANLKTVYTRKGEEGTYVAVCVKQPELVT